MWRVNYMNVESYLIATLFFRRRFVKIQQLSIVLLEKLEKLWILVFKRGYVFLLLSCSSIWGFLEEEWTSLMISIRELVKDLSKYLGVRLLLVIPAFIMVQWPIRSIFKLLFVYLTGPWSSITLVLFLLARRRSLWLTYYNNQTHASMTK